MTWAGAGLPTCESGGPQCLAKKNMYQDRFGTPDRRGRVRELPEAGSALCAEMNILALASWTSAPRAAGEEIGTRLGRGDRVESGKRFWRRSALRCARPPLRRACGAPAGCIPRARAAREACMPGACAGPREQLSWREAAAKPPPSAMAAADAHTRRPPATSPSEGHPPSRVSSSTSQILKEGLGEPI